MNTGKAGICKEHVHGKIVNAAATGTAGTTGDNTEVQQAEADAIDLKDHEGEHALLVIPWTAAITDTKHLAFRVRTRTASTAADAANATAVEQLALTSGVAKLADSSTTFRGCYMVNLPNAVGENYAFDRYLLVDVTGDLNNGGTDTFSYMAALIFTKDRVVAD